MVGVNFIVFTVGNSDDGTVFGMIPKFFVCFFLC